MDPSHENRERVSHAYLPRVVIVGGGFGGLSVARGLARAPVTVTVVDKHNYHLFRPMLYQVATGLLSSDEVAAPIRSILRRQKNVTVLMAEVIGVDPHARVVFTREGTVAYDYLVLATGIEYNYFGHEEWKALKITSVLGSGEPPNHTFEQTAGSRTLASAAQRSRSRKELSYGR